MQTTFSIIKKHERFRKNCINLLPSENILSNKAKKALSSDLATRYTLPINQEVHCINAYRGTKYIDEIESNAEKLAREIFNFKFASLVMFLSVCKKGDKICKIICLIFFL